MSTIDEIKERVKNYQTEYLPYFKSNDEMHKCNTMYKDIQYLISKLEIAEKALEAAKKEFDSDDHQHYDGDRWIKYIETTDAYKQVIEALKQIKEK